MHDEYVIKNTQRSFNRQFQQTQPHFGADVDYFEKLSLYLFDAGVIKLHKEIKVSELFENEVFN